MIGGALGVGLAAARSAASPPLRGVDSTPRSRRNRRACTRLCGRRLDRNRDPVRAAASDPRPTDSVEPRRRRRARRRPVVRAGQEPGRRGGPRAGAGVAGRRRADAARGGTPDARRSRLRSSGRDDAQLLARRAGVRRRRAGCRLHDPRPRSRARASRRAVCGAGRADSARRQLRQLGLSHRGPSQSQPVRRPVCRALLGHARLFRTLRIPLLRGRLLTDADRAIRCQ